MNPGKQLHDLQEVDLELESKAEMLSQVESQLSSNAALAETTTNLERHRQELAELEKEQKATEWVTDDLLAKVAPLQKKLYDGSVKNPKELDALQQQVQQLKAQIRQEEDKTLEAMGKVEAVQKKIQQQAAEVKRLKEEWGKKREELSAEQASLMSAIESASKKREELATVVEAAHLELYETLRATKQGQAVARIEQGRCQGCRITLSMKEVKRATVGELVQCDSCSRVLFIG